MLGNFTWSFLLSAFFSCNVCMLGNFTWSFLLSAFFSYSLGPTIQEPDTDHSEINICKQQKPMQNHPESNDLSLRREKVVKTEWDKLYLRRTNILNLTLTGNQHCSRWQLCDIFFFEVEGGGSIQTLFDVNCQFKTWIIKFFILNRTLWDFIGWVFFSKMPSAANKWWWSTD